MITTHHVYSVENTREKRLVTWLTVINVGCSEAYKIIMTSRVESIIDDRADVVQIIPIIMREFMTRANKLLCGHEESKHIQKFEKTNRVLFGLK